MIRSVPLLVIPFALYNILMFMGDAQSTLGAQLFSFGLMSGAQWIFTISDAFIVGGILVLYVEVFKSTGTGITAVLDHTLSTLLFVGFLIEFLLVAGCGTSTFFILCLMSLLDVIAGFTVSIVAARRDFTVGPQDF